MYTDGPGCFSLVLLTIHFEINSWRIHICFKRPSFCPPYLRSFSWKCANYISCLQRTMQCNNVMLVMINHPTLFHSLAGRAAAVKLQWVSKLLLLLTAQLTTQILASQTAVQTENWLQRKLQEMIYANLASRGRNIAIKFAIWKSALIVRVSWYLCLQSVFASFNIQWRQNLEQSFVLSFV